MNNYAKEIKKLKEEIGEIDEKIKELAVEKLNIKVACGPAMHDMISLIRTIEGMDGVSTYKRLVKLLHRLDEIEEEINMLCIRRRSKLREINELKDAVNKEYIERHSVDFYRPMDMIDICEIIHNNGSIRGVKF